MASCQGSVSATASKRIELKSTRASTCMNRKSVKTEWRRPVLRGARVRMRVQNYEPSGVQPLLAKNLNSNSSKAAPRPLQLCLIRGASLEAYSRPRERSLRYVS
eukprot:6187549-Pleurochrysis_carterae.AAC.1